MADKDPYQNIIDKLKGEVVQVGTDCTINIYNITNYYNHPPPTDQQAQGQTTVTVQEKVKVEVIKSDGRPRESSEPSSAVTWVDWLWPTVELEPGDVVIVNPRIKGVLYIGDGMIVTVRGGTVMKERVDDIEGFRKRTPRFKSGVRVFPKMEAVRRAKGKVGDSFTSLHEFRCWCYTGLTCEEACGCDPCLLRGVFRKIWDLFL